MFDLITWIYKIYKLSNKNKGESMELVRYLISLFIATILVNGYFYIKDKRKK
ncbi:hypothetical protein FC23_GL000767 [Lactobacillus psittaci DSM 15354]|uniref:Uncharacterized protein n=1 Tax=Lactobacillus psittaci DSM 15354 TaxID=1122152 RepID=A0A0R1S7L6_9LACO|nr:hypothetical protein FC23_GL000767 [Lactobacillus psittaci DSM 15354]